MILAEVILTLLRHATRNSKNLKDLHVRSNLSIQSSKKNGVYKCSLSNCLVFVNFIEAKDLESSVTKKQYIMISLFYCNSRNTIFS